MTMMAMHLSLDSGLRAPHIEYQMMNNKFKVIVYWFGWFLLYLSVIIGTGGIIGSCLYMAMGLVTHPDLSWSERALYGLRDGSQYAGIWAGGLSMVLCCMKGYQQTVAAQPQTEEMERS